MPWQPRIVRQLIASVVFAFLLTACQLPSRQKWVRTEIYFGQSRQNGTLIEKKEWQAFLDEVVTPEFPVGLTLLEASGQWRNTAGRIDHEPSKVLVLIHPPDPRIESKIDAIRAIYRERFEQEAVLKVTSRAFVEF